MRSAAGQGLARGEGAALSGGMAPGAARRAALPFLGLRCSVPRIKRTGWGLGLHTTTCGARGATSASASGSGPGPSAPGASTGAAAAGEGAASLFQQHAWVRTLEICPGREGPWSLLPGGQAAGRDLLERGAFHATVRPDLPAVATLRGAAEELLPLLRPLSRWRGTQGQGHASTSPKAPAGAPAAQAPAEAHVAGEAPSPTPSPQAQPSGSAAWEVRTVAAQTRPLQQLQQLVQERGRLVTADAAGGGALLILSGGHPLRQVPLLSPLMPSNSVEVLRAARRMKESGALPQALGSGEPQPQHPPEPLQAPAQD